jgi:hypothetical protein
MVAAAALLLVGVLFLQANVMSADFITEKPAEKPAEQAVAVATTKRAAFVSQRYLLNLPKELLQNPSSSSSQATLTSALALGAPSSTPPPTDHGHGPQGLLPAYNANGPVFSRQSLKDFGNECKTYYTGIGPEAFLCSEGQPLGIEDTDPPTFPGRNNYMNALSDSVRFRLPSKQEAYERNAKNPFVFPGTSVGQRFDKLEFQCYSQNSEDGILLAIFGAIGVTNRRGLEIAGGVGWENNLANLVINFGFDALFFDGDQGNHRCANNFFKNHPATRERYAEKRIVFSDAFVKKNDINAKIYELTGGWNGEIDVFSLDIDGVDYWIWDVLERVNPRVVVVETQELWGWKDRYVIKYDETYNSNGVMSTMGASLAAYVELAEKRGYRLVGCIREGYNAFFIREDAIDGGLDSLFGKGKYNPSGCFSHVDDRWKRTLHERRREALQKYAHLWVDPVTMKTLDPKSPDQMLWS